MNRDQIMQIAMQAALAAVAAIEESNSRVAVEPASPVTVEDGIHCEMTSTELRSSEGVTTSMSDSGVDFEAGLESAFEHDFTTAGFETEAIPEELFEEKVQPSPQSPAVHQHGKQHGHRRGHRGLNRKPKPQMDWEPQLNSDQSSRAELMQPLSLLQQLQADRTMVFFRHANRRKRNGHGMVGNSLFIVVRKKAGRVQYVTRSIWNDDASIICPDIAEHHWFDLSTQPGKHEFVQYHTPVDDYFVAPPYQYLLIGGEYYIAAADDQIELTTASEAQLMGSTVSVSQRVLKTTVLAAKLAISPIIDFRQRREVQALDYTEIGYRLGKAIDHDTAPIEVSDSTYKHIGRYPMVTVFAGGLVDEIDLGTVSLRFRP